MNTADLNATAAAAIVTARTHLTVKECLDLADRQRKADEAFAAECDRVFKAAQPWLLLIGMGALIEVGYLIITGA